MLQSKGNENHNSIQIPRGPGRPSLAEISVDEIETEEQIQARDLSRTQRIGAQFAIQAICTYFESELIEKIPILWTLIKNTIQITDDELENMYATNDTFLPINYDKANEMITCLQLIECSATVIHSSLIDDLLELLPKLNLLLRYPLKAVSNLIFFFFSFYRKPNNDKN